MLMLKFPQALDNDQRAHCDAWSQGPRGLFRQRWQLTVSVTRVFKPSSYCRERCSIPLSCLLSLRQPERGLILKSSDTVLLQSHTLQLAAGYLNMYVRNLLYS